MIDITPTFHYDVIYLKESKAYLEQAFQILDAALDLLEKEPDYRYTIEAVYLVERYWAARPEKRTALKKFARAGRLDFAPGMYVMPDMNLTDGESLFRQAEFGRRWLKRHLGVQPESCWIADCWGHPAQLPQILSQCGYRTYFFWRCMRPDWKKRVFRWRSLGGTTLPAVWLSDGYSGVHFAPPQMENREEQELISGNVETLREKAAQLRKFGGGNILIPQGGDFAMPEPMLPETVRQIAPAFPEGLRIATVSEFAKNIDFSRAPETGGEFNGAFQGTYTTNGSVKRRTNALVRDLLALERRCVAAGRPARLDAVWKKVLKCQFHDSICGTVCDRGLQEIGRDLDAAEKMLKKRRGEGGTFLFNPLGRTRTAVVSTAEGLKRVTVPGLTSIPLSSGKTLKGKTGEITLPATFHNEFYTVTVGTNGLPESLRTPQGAELVRNSFFGELAMQIDNGDNWLNFESPLNGSSAYTHLCPDPLERETTGLSVVRSFFPGIREVTAAYRQGELVVRRRGVLAFWKLATEFQMEIAYSQHSPLIRFRVTLFPKGKHYRIRAVFPLQAERTKVTHGTAFGLLARPRAELPMNEWFDCRNARQGLSVIAPGIYGACADAENNMMLTLFRSVAMEYKCDSEKSFQEGVMQSFEYAVYPHGGGKSFAVTAALAEEFAFPLQSCQKALTSPIPLELPGSVRLSALKAVSEKVYFLRLAEVCGQKTVLRLPGWCMAPADGFGNRTGRFQAPTTIMLKPFEILNLQISKIS